MTRIPRSLLDHVILAVRDIDTAAATYAALGFTLSEPGVHPTRGTLNRCIAFPNAYLELLSVAGAHAREAFLVEFLARREGGSSIAFAMDDPGRVHAVLRDALPDLEPPVTGSREIHGRSGIRSIAFDVQRVPPDGLLPGRFFFCRHHHREEVYAAALQAHANGARRLARVVVAGDPAAIRWPRALDTLGYRRLEHSALRLRIDCAGVELAFVAPGALREEVSAAELPDPPADGIVLLEIEAARPRRVPAAAAHGVVLAFTAPR